jgi:hypothetical protein
MTIRPDDPADDYFIETEDTTPRVPFSYRFMRLLQGIVVLVIAALSLALFWLIGLILGVF